MLVCVMGFNGGPGTITKPAGWIDVGSAVGQTNPDLYVFAKVCGGSEPASYDFTISNSIYNGYVCARYSGVDNTTPLDVTAVGTDGAAALTYSLTGLTTASNGAMLVVGVSANSSTAARLSVNGGEPVTEFAEVFQSSAIKDTMMADGAFATAGATGTIDGAIDQSLAWAGVVAALK